MLKKVSEALIIMSAYNAFSALSSNVKSGNIGFTATYVALRIAFALEVRIHPRKFVQCVYEGPNYSVYHRCDH